MKEAMKNLSKITELPSRAAIQVQARSLTIRSRQKGASALEYLVLAGALVAIMVFAFSNDAVQQTVKDIFDGMFAKVPG